MRKITSLLLIIGNLALGGCSAIDDGSLFPGPFFARNFPPPGPENYRTGMTDGCKTASSAAGNALLSVIYDRVYYDVNRALTDKVYYSAWQDGYNYCKYELDASFVS